LEELSACGPKFGDFGYGGLLQAVSFLLDKVVRIALDLLILFYTLAIS
jgi:hypothetical protein